MTAAALTPLRFQLGARTLWSVPRRLVRIGLSLEDAMAGAAPVLPPLPPDADGFLLTSLPVATLPALSTRGLLVRERQRYARRYLDGSIGDAAWWAGLTGRVRGDLGRKRRRLADANGGRLDVRRFASAADLAIFHPAARAVSATSYQERLLDAGLDRDPAALLRAAARDEVRAWLLYLGDRPVAYLLCTADGRTLRYDHVGHDPVAAALSPGSVLMAEASRDILREGRWRWFDFTEGDGQHKRTLATGGLECVDLLLMRPTLANRLACAALAGFDRTAAWGRGRLRHPALARVAKAIRR